MVSRNCRSQRGQRQGAASASGSSVALQRLAGRPQQPPALPSPPQTALWAAAVGPEPGGGSSEAAPQTGQGSAMRRSPRPAPTRAMSVEAQPRSSSMLRLHTARFCVAQAAMRSSGGSGAPEVRTSMLQGGEARMRGWGRGRGTRATHLAAPHCCWLSWLGPCGGSGAQARFARGRRR